MFSRKYHVSLFILSDRPFLPSSAGMNTRMTCSNIANAFLRLSVVFMTETITVPFALNTQVSSLKIAVDRRYLRDVSFRSSEHSGHWPRGHRQSANIHRWRDLHLLSMVDILYPRWRGLFCSLWRRGEIPPVPEWRLSQVAAPR